MTAVKFSLAHCRTACMESSQNPMALRQGKYLVDLHGIFVFAVGVHHCAHE